MTSPLVHSWRLFKWGRTLARHGALRPIENDPNAPKRIRRFARLLRIGTGAPTTPRFADAFQAIGPAAIKLGQTLATRPDLVGDAAAHDLLRLQDRLPAVPFATICAAIEASYGRPVTQFFASIEEDPVGAASIAQVHRAVTTDGRQVAIKVLRPGVEEDFTRAIDTYQWAAAQLEAMSVEARRLRPRLTIETFKRWTQRELNFQREAASASELAEAMTAEPDFAVPAIDWQRSTSKVLTIEWIDGIKLSNRQALVTAGYDLPHLARTLVHAFLRQAIADGFFHADMHQGNLFALPGANGRGRIAAIDFGIMGRIDRRARVWLAEILYGLITGNYRRVAEIHFEAGYVPAHHNVAEFATALRAVGEPMRGLPVKDMSIGMMLDGLFSITRDFDMVTQPHLLLLQKTMVMVEGVATSLDPEINLWDTAAPFVREWIRTELGPEAYVADRLITDLRTFANLPDLIRRIEARYPAPGGEPPAPPLREIEVVQLGGGWRYAATALTAAVVGSGAMWFILR
ncbi:ubiquinone biosynthesis protein [Sphingomonas jinjuensis]|uniref:Ubiquinone biosynthesis protein n=1 Tax=Sphingomonas jinjuensis TaxID=535907 RepID=A0A840FEM0_9SPHN|nr:2-polyprenylphenol 6-hydroxylase [Sphingomonas jinjuensis]MBB4155122.1 ubiquinone biosynthesis protein [Sphingomonas jinjuensis]